MFRREPPCGERDRLSGLRDIWTTLISDMDLPSRVQQGRLRSLNVSRLFALLGYSHVQAGPKKIAMVS